MSDWKEDEACTRLSAAAFLGVVARMPDWKADDARPRLLAAISLWMLALTQTTPGVTRHTLAFWRVYWSGDAGSDSEGAWGAPPLAKSGGVAPVFVSERSYYTYDFLKQSWLHLGKRPACLCGFPPSWWPGHQRYSCAEHFLEFLCIYQDIAVLACVIGAHNDPSPEGFMTSSVSASNSDELLASDQPCLIERRTPCQRQSMASPNARSRVSHSDNLGIIYSDDDDGELEWLIAQDKESEKRTRDLDLLHEIQAKTLFSHERGFVHRGDEDEA
ncbi:hypothetical protein ACLMJK_004809 [Lecanora helva]